MGTIKLPNNSIEFFKSNQNKIFESGNLAEGPWNKQLSEKIGCDVDKVGPVQDRAVYDNAKSFSLNISKGNVQAKHGSDSVNSESTPY